MARTVDHISGGRLILGLGSGWYEKDYTVYGYDFGTVKSRMDLFEDNLVAHRRQARPSWSPSPVRKIPILVGGMGVKRTLPIVAKHADIWHTFASVAEYRRKNAILKDLVAEAGRDENADRAGGALDWT